MAYIFMSMRDFRLNQSDLLNRVDYNQDIIILTKRGKPKSKIISISAEEKINLMQLMQQESLTKYIKEQAGTE